MIIIQQLTKLKTDLKSLKIKYVFGVGFTKFKNNQNLQ